MIHEWIQAAGKESAAIFKSGAQRVSFNKKSEIKSASRQTKSVQRHERTNETDRPVSNILRLA